MKTPTEDNTGRHPSSKVTEEEWLEKKDALLKRLTRHRRTLKAEKEDLTRERERLISGIEGLEEENHLMAKSVKDFELQLSKKRRVCQTLYKRSDELKEEQARSLAREHNLLNEIELYDSEKAKLSDMYSEVSERLRTNVSALESAINDIGFMKGEVRALMEKMEMLEGEVPMKFKDVDNLDEKISASIKALRGLYNRMQGTERDVKISYYKKKKRTGE
jgi:chromosome segregation ATPase